MRRGPAHLLPNTPSTLSTRFITFVLSSTLHLFFPSPFPSFQPKTFFSLDFRYSFPCFLVGKSQITYPYRRRLVSLLPPFSSLFRSIHYNSILPSFCDVVLFSISVG